jgi:cytochrome c oxidase subunit II
MRWARGPAGFGWRAARAVLVAGLSVGLVACSDDAPSALDPRGPDSQRIATSWWLLFGLGAAVYVVVAGFIVRGLGRPAPVPQQRLILLGGIVVPTLVLAVVGVETVQATRAVFEDDTDARIVVDGRQYWWEVRYPGDGVVTANEVHIPAGEKVTVDLVTDDVIHSFWVPELTGKLDMIPGQTNQITFEADEPGTYRGQCAEFCGIQHAYMAFVVVAHEPADFDRWLADRQEPPSRPEGPQARRGRQVLESEACAGCHTVAGTNATGDEGPDLSDVAARRELGAGATENTPEELRRWIRDSQDIKPGNHMPPIELSDRDLDALVAYLEQLDGT